MQRRTGYKGPEAITISDMKAYFDMMAWEPIEMTFALDLLTEMDQVYLTAKYEEIAEEQRRKAERDAKRGG